MQDCCAGDCIPYDRATGDWKIPNDRSAEPINPMTRKELRGQSLETLAATARRIGLTVPNVSSITHPSKTKEELKQLNARWRTRMKQDLIERIHERLTNPSADAKRNSSRGISSESIRADLLKNLRSRNSIAPRKTR